LTISGPASPGITIDGGSKVQVMQVASVATLNLNNLTIADGYLDLNSRHFDGGGIDNEGTLRVTNSTFSANKAVNGAGIYNVGMLTVTNSNFSGNSVEAVGGGIYNHAGILTVINSTFCGNSGAAIGGGGGGIATDGTVNAANTVSNSTFCGNSGGGGGGIAI